MDELESRIRAARPASGHRDLPLTERAERELDALTRDGTGGPEAAAGANPAGQTRTQAAAATPGPDDADPGAPTPRGHRLLLALVASIVLIAAVSIPLGLRLWQPEEAPVPPASPEPSPTETSPAPEETSPDPEPTEAEPPADPSVVHSPLPEPDPIDGTTQETLLQLAAIAETGPEPVSEEIVTYREWWYLEREHDYGETQAEIIPQLIATEIDESGDVRRQTTYAGLARDQYANPVAGQEPPAGEYMRSQTHRPGESPWSGNENPPEDPALMPEHLAIDDSPHGDERDYDAALAFERGAGILASPLSTPGQRAAYLGHLATLPEVELAGVTEDRHGREGLVFVTPSGNQGDQARLIIDRETALALGHEIVYTGGEHYLGVEPPTIVWYQAWNPDLPEGM